MRHRIRGGRALIVVGLAAALALSATAAHAAPGAKAGRWSSFTVVGAGGALAMAPGFPAATFASDAPSLAAFGGAVLPASTPPGVEYGSSSGGTYLSLRPLSTGAASTTTIAFASPTPAAHWSIVLGDVDAEITTVTAVGPAGPLTSAQLGVVAGFNSAGGAAVPVRTTGPTSESFTGDALGTDTDGSATWLSPTAPISTLTFTVSRVSGSAAVQVWLVGHVASLAGLVTDPAGAPVPGATVTVDDPAGGALPGGPLTATTDAAGAFDIAEVFGSDVSLIATAPGRSPGGRVVVTPTLDGAGDPVFASLVAVAAGDLVPAAPPAPPAAPTLAETGADGSWWPLGVALAGLGVGALLAGRRRTAR